MAAEKPIGRCPRCRVEVIRDLPGRCTDKLCPPLEPLESSAPVEKEPG